MSVSWSEAEYQADGRGVRCLPNGGYEITEVWHIPVTISDDLPDVAAVCPQYDDENSTYARHYVTDVDIKFHQAGSNCAIVTVTYASDREAGRQNSHGEIWEWNFAGDSKHITAVERDGTSGPQTQNHYPASGCRYTGRAIGVDGDNVEGCDIVAPALQLRIEKEWRWNGSNWVNPVSNLGMPGSTPAGYRTSILSCVGKVDAALIASHQVLMVGANLTKTDIGRWRGCYDFLVGPASANISVMIWDEGTGAEVTTSIGPVGSFDYVWFTHGKKLVSAGITQNVILAAHIARVYDTPSVSFATALGIEGTY